MKASVETRKTVTLVMNEKEAEWLRRFIQNPMEPMVEPIGVTRREGESEVDCDMRQAFFETLVILKDPKL